ncbi:hypothetical protein AB1L30_06910 [Bremerella sp. JC817]|uniref:hypothetical protein n=1 Tax=Bremerella sp. JC817 TaxID=3231756 RepID=UPI003457E59F
MITRIFASLALVAILGSSLVSTAEAGLFGRRASFPGHHAPRTSYRVYNSTPSYSTPAISIIRHVNDPSMFLNESNYGES